jgi:hypothetical protein
VPVSASEKLKAMLPMYEIDKGTLPLTFTDAFPQIVAVVEAAEQGRDRSVLIEEHVSTIEKVAWRVEDAQALQAALAALDKALT